MIQLPDLAAIACYGGLLRVPRSLLVSGHPNVPEVNNGCASKPDQRSEIAARQKENVVEHVRRNFELSWAVAVVPRHVRQVQQIEGGLKVVIVGDYFRFSICNRSRSWLADGEIRAHGDCSGPMWMPRQMVPEQQSVRYFVELGGRSPTTRRGCDDHGPTQVAHRNAKPRKLEGSRYVVIEPLVSTHPQSHSPAMPASLATRIPEPAHTREHAGTAGPVLIGWSVRVGSMASSWYPRSTQVS
jgi:hypothetical protein